MERQRYDFSYHVVDELSRGWDYEHNYISGEPGKRLVPCERAAPTVPLLSLSIVIAHLSLSLSFYRKT